MKLSIQATKKVITEAFFISYPKVDIIFNNGNIIEKTIANTIVVSAVINQGSSLFKLLFSWSCALWFNKIDKSSRAFSNFPALAAIFKVLKSNDSKMVLFNKSSYRPSEASNCDLALFSFSSNLRF